MDITEFILDWWRANSGEFSNLEGVMPHIVLHKAPAATDFVPHPLLIGAEALQAEVVGSHDPAEYQRRLFDDWLPFSGRVITEHRRICAAGQPDIVRGQFSPFGGVAGAFDFERLALPVHTCKGGRFLMTYTRRVTLH